MKRHEFEMLAAALRDARADITNKEPEESHADMLDGVDLASEHIADALARGTAPGGNRAFDRERFLKDAGVQS